MKVHTYANGAENSKKDVLDVHDEQRFGRSSVSDETIVKVEEAILKYRKVMVRELSERYMVSAKTSIDRILIDRLGYSKVCVMWVLRMLTEEHNVLKGNVLK